LFNPVFGSRGAGAREARKRVTAVERRHQRAREALRKRLADLEGRIAKREAEIKTLEATMAAPGFYDDRDASQPIVERYEALMWEVGDLMGQWEALQEHAARAGAVSDFAL
jgi:hypothetical protein